MSARANKLKVGIFVVVFFILLFVFLSIIGGLETFRPVVKCMTLVNSSVQGLSVGAKVKYNGVAIGQVTRMKISTEEKDLITIYMDIYTDNFASEKAGKKESVKYFTDFIEKNIKNGLRCQLRYEGITGTLYQEIRFFDEKKNPYANFELPDNHPLYIPSVEPILFSDILKRIDSSLEKTSQIDKVINNLAKTIDKINHYLDGPQISKIFDEINQIGVNLNSIASKFNETMTKERLSNIAKQLEEILKQVNTLSANMNEQLMAAEIPRTTADARSLMNEINGKLNDSMNNFNQAVNNLQHLTNTLNKKPNSILYGNDNKKVAPSY